MVCEAERLLCGRFVCTVALGIGGRFACIAALSIGRCITRARRLACGWLLALRSRIIITDSRTCGFAAIGDIPTRPLENDAHWLENSSYHTSARRTLLQRLVLKRLKLLELCAACVTSIDIGRHTREPLMVISHGILRNIVHYPSTPINRLILAFYQKPSSHQVGRKRKHSRTRIYRTRMPILSSFDEHAILSRYKVGTNQMLTLPRSRNA